jgi:hypothetical protein
MHRTVPQKYSTLNSINQVRNNTVRLSKAEELFIIYENPLCSKVAGLLGEVWEALEI